MTGRLQIAPQREKGRHLPFRVALPRKEKDSHKRLHRGRAGGGVTHHKKGNGLMQMQTGCSPRVSAELRHKYWGGTKETDFLSL